MSAESPKKTAPKPKKPAKLAEHPKYIDMVKAAIAALKERSGSSRQAIEKYIKANYKVGDNVGPHLKLALKKGVTSGALLHPKGTGASGSFKVNKAVAEPKKKPAANKPAAKKPVAKKPAAKKLAAKKPAAKKPAAKKPAAKKAEKPSAKKAAKKAVKKPAAKKTAKPKAAKKPAAMKPAAKKPAAKKAAKSPKKAAKK